MADIIDYSLNEIRLELRERLTTLLAASSLAQQACLPRLTTLITYYLVYEEGELSFEHFIAQLSKPENQWRCFMIFGSSLPEHELHELLETSVQHQEELDDMMVSLGMYLP
ncbi:MULTISPECIES: hypothetical protein [Gammaproteobacteria]|nr:MULTISPECIES: hypothetical protein [Gammaproteobacteria]EKT9734990.1 hypothetical protein [Proteus mirabilis]EJD6501295.1 hypothetical protein [Providencia rettgeri]EKW6744366.1 hypothetical protein [Proteus mirabilis]EKX9075238.1 hypothetical protein [Proteus mirabilis]MBN4867356.1 hypothetical protein [Providencia stuartii]